MNPDTYEFEKATPRTDALGWKSFTIGETFKLNGVEFRIRKITKKDIIIRPVKPEVGK